MSHPLFDLSNRVALVSGAASGLGKAMAIGFAEAGADLVLADINADGLATTARELGALGRRVLPVTCDVSQPDQIRTMFELIDAEYGRIDIVGNVAGNARRNTPLDLTPEEVEFTLQNLVVGRLVCCQEAGRRMMASGNGGSIINLVSIAGINALGRSHLSYSMGMGGRRADDPRVEHGVGRQGRARQRHCLRSVNERGPKGAHRRGPRAG